MTATLPWAHVLAVAVGAAFRTLARWFAGLWLSGQWAGFPLGTLLVNCIGGLLIGVALAWFERSPDELLRLLLETGFLGGLTTFSAFSGESLVLLQRAQFALAMAHTAAHLFGSLGCAALGYGLLRGALR